MSPGEPRLTQRRARVSSLHSDVRRSTWRDWTSSRAACNFARACKDSDTHPATAPESAFERARPRPAPHVPPQPARRGGRASRLLRLGGSARGHRVHRVHHARQLLPDGCARARACESAAEALRRRLSRCAGGDAHLCTPSSGGPPRSCRRTRRRPRRCWRGKEASAGARGGGAARPPRLALTSRAARRRPGPSPPRRWSPARRQSAGAQGWARAGEGSAEAARLRLHRSHKRRRDLVGRVPRDAALRRGLLQRRCGAGGAQRCCTAAAQQRGHAQRHQALTTMQTHLPS